MVTRSWGRRAALLAGMAAVLMPIACDPQLPSRVFDVLSGYSAVESRMRAAPCRSQVCDPERWLPIALAFDYVDPWARWEWATPEHCGLSVSYVAEFASANNRIVSASANQLRSLRLATITSDGTLHLADFASPTADASVDLGAVGVAWSNDGETLAVVTRNVSAGQPAYELRLLSPQLTVLAQLPLDLPALPSDAPLARFVVSWSPDDAKLAVSTDGTRTERGDGTRVPAPPPRCLVVDVGTWTTDAYELFNAYFIGPDTLVASLPLAPGSEERFAFGRVHRLVLQGGSITDQSAVVRPDVVLASHPPTGVFMTREPDPVGWVYFPVKQAALRTTELGPHIVGWEVAVPDLMTFVLTPLDAALPALEATGFGPNDAPQRDPVTGGCPG